jgi:signal transduction histidine kinase
VRSVASLRNQLSLPMLIGSLAVAIGISVVSYFWAMSRADAEIDERFASIERILKQSDFPLTHNVLQMLAGLTDAAWIKMNDDGRVEDYAIPERTSVDPLKALDDRLLPEWERLLGQPTKPIGIEIGGRSYTATRLADLGQRITRPGSRSNHLIVMVADERRQVAILQATLPPIVTGLVTIAVLGTLSFLLSERLIKRIGKLRGEIDKIGMGNFEFNLPRDSKDEIDNLAGAIQLMSEQLGRMWRALQHTHAQKLIHQIASGLAHNLRNTLTGARLAVELGARQQTGPFVPSVTSHGSGANQSQESPLMVAVGQLKQAEEYIQRLLSLARGLETKPNAASISECLSGLKSGLNNTASHRGVQLDWKIDFEIGAKRVPDGSALISAISNLAWNAMEAGTRVTVRAQWMDSTRSCRIEVSDNGPGPSPEIMPSMFEPFATSKPEGMGLGLTLVQQAAESLQATLQWNRRDDWTVFQFDFTVCENELNCCETET